ncbi:hypothetical protein U1Q18_039239 [Sarracenia purpurea var. burkii]
MHPPYVDRREVLQPSWSDAGECSPKEVLSRIQRKGGKDDDPKDGRPLWVYVIKREPSVMGQDVDREDQDFVEVVADYSPSSWWDPGIKARGRSLKSRLLRSSCRSVGHPPYVDEREVLQLSWSDAGECSLKEALRIKDNLILFGYKVGLSGCQRIPLSSGSCPMRCSSALVTNWIPFACMYHNFCNNIYPRIVNKLDAYNGDSVSVSQGTLWLDCLGWPRFRWAPRPARACCAWARPRLWWAPRRARAFYLPLPESHQATVLSDALTIDRGLLIHRVFHALKGGHRSHSFVCD